MDTHDVTSRTRATRRASRILGRIVLALAVPLTAAAPLPWAPTGSVGDWLLLAGMTLAVTALPYGLLTCYALLVDREDRPFYYVTGAGLVGLIGAGLWGWAEQVARWAAAAGVSSPGTVAGMFVLAPAGGVLAWWLRLRDRRREQEPLRPATPTG